MKKLFILFCFLFSISALPAGNVITLPYTAKDIKYSAKHDKLYAIIDAMNTEYGNRLVEINPNTGAVERSIFVGSMPWKIRLTNDEDFVWISLYASPFMKRVDLNTFTIDKKVYLGPSIHVIQKDKIKQMNSHIICYNFSVSPDDNTRLALALKTDFVFDFEGIALYKNDTIQPKRVLPYIDTEYIPGCIEFVQNGNYVVGARQSNFESVFTTMQVADTGLNMLNEFDDLVEVYELRRNWFKVHNDTLFIAEGVVIDATDINNLNSIGRCENDFIDDYYGFAFSEIHDAFVYPNFHDDSLFLTFYNKKTFEPFDTIFMMKYHFYELMLVAHLEIMGLNKFALMVGKDYGFFKTYLIEGQGLGTKEHLLEKPVKIFPNPASDYLFVEGLTPNGKIEIYDVTGRLVLWKKTMNKRAKIDIRGLKKGIYLLQTTGAKNANTMITQKLIIQ